VCCPCTSAGCASRRVALDLFCESLAADVAVLLLLLQAPLSATTTSGLPSITAVFTDITPGMTSVVGNEGHPEMADYVKQRTAGPASLQMAFVPSAAGDGEGASDFVITSGAELLDHAAPLDGSPCTCTWQNLLQAAAR
jgi:hypothetical protein